MYLEACPVHRVLRLNVCVGVVVVDKTVIVLVKAVPVVHLPVKDSCKPAGRS